jgi:hypothetical protein
MPCLATVDAQTEVVVVDDATDDLALAAALDALSSRRAHHAAAPMRQNQGFVGVGEPGLGAAPDARRGAAQFRYAGIR